MSDDDHNPNAAAPAPDEIINWIRIGGQDEHLKSGELAEARLGRRAADALSQLFQVDHISALLGSGFTIGAAGLLGVDAPSMAKASAFGDLQSNVDERANSTAASMGRESGNLEDQLRAALELHTGLVILKDPQADAVRVAINEVLTRLVDAVLTTEREVHARLADEAGVDKGESLAHRATRILQSFLLTFAGSRGGTKHRFEIFTTNYDRLIEYCCDLTGLRIIDRFVGQMQPEFRSTRVGIDIHYSPPGMRGEPRYVEGVVRLAKLHGSVDWMHKGSRIVREPLRFGAEGPATAALADSLMVFPNAAKDVETAFFPYAELFRDMSAAICQPNSTLVTYGYGFGDDHVNRVIRDMLSLSATHLVILSYDDPEGRIQRYVEAVGRPTQVSVLVGSDVASLDRLVENYFPQPLLAVRQELQPGDGIANDPTSSSSEEAVVDEPTGAE